MSALLTVKNATLKFSDREVWSDVNFEVSAGEFIAIIGSNGSGKSMLLKSILGQQELSTGQIHFEHENDFGYIPQHRAADISSTLKVKDLVRFGLDGEKFGFNFPSRTKSEKVDSALEAVDALHLKNVQVGKLSGGEFQRVRVAQAIIDNPKLILADEPLSALDLHHQMTISELIDKQRKLTGAAVLFVTHDLNPIIDFVDRVLYLANGKHSIGTVEEVMRSDVLSGLYGHPVDVVRNQGRIVVLGSHDHDHHDHEEWV